MLIPVFGIIHGGFGLLFLLLYFLPIFLAVSRRSPSVVGIALVNILLGWSVIGWIVALIWALSTPRGYVPPPGPPPYGGPAYPPYAPPPRNAAAVCPNCRMPVGPGENYCPNCGARL